MPYIKNINRRELLSGLRKPLTPGELNYLLTTVALDYLPATPTYTNYNEVIGVLECIKLELYRRAVSSYEDTMLEANGDVY